MTDRDFSAGLERSKELFDQGLVDDGVALLNQLIVRGSAHAALTLGHHYEVKGQNDLALASYRKSRELGSMLGHYYLAHLLENVGDQINAFKEMEDLAQQGYLPAINQLGRLYIAGIGCQPNVTSGAHYRNVAADRGHLRAQRWQAGQLLTSGSTLNTCKGVIKMAILFFKFIAAAGLGETDERLL